MTALAFTLTEAPAAAGALRLELRGALTLADGARLWRELRARLSSARAIELDLGGVVRLDGGAAALLTTIVAEQRRRGARCDVVGASAESARLLGLYDCARGADCELPAPVHPSLLSEIGSFTVGLAGTVRAILAFVGDFAVGIGAAVRRPRSLHLGELGLLVERAGADGVPIVLLINFLVGAILALQGAIQLHRFGGDQFLANLVGLSIVRELGPLMTAILVTGRSGAAFASELGTMTVNEEIDALRTIGQDPQRFLVFPRILALVLVMPPLTVLADLVGSCGGLVIALTYLDQPAAVYLQALARAVDFADVGTGLIKSGAFSLAIGLVACQRGLATRGGADGVGRATTSAVVTSLFLLVAIDAVLTWIFSLLRW